jgi:tetraacyldisaccharide 4'-kinase
MNPMRYFLLPFSYLYGIGVRLRNWLFDKEIVISASFDLPLIGIGNLSAGGTGKTPMAEYVLRILLEHDIKPALLSRGYGRQTKGFQIVKPFSTAALVGDEPHQIKRKFPDVAVAVCEDRATGIRHIMEHFPDTEVIVLDDSFQHRAVKTGFTILLTDFNKPYFRDLLLPAGMLREPQSGKERADVIIMTKCPVAPDENKKTELKRLLKPGAGQEVYFTCIRYGALVKTGAMDEEEIHFPLEHIRGYKILLFTGIANPAPLEKFLKENSAGVQSIAFPDHHTFSQTDTLKILNAWKAMPEMNKLLLTTEKDWRRLEYTAEAGLFEGTPVYFLPIEVEWKQEEKLSFDDKLIGYVSANKRVG